MIILFFIIFTILEAYSTMQLYRKNLKLNVKGTIINYFIFCLYLIINYLFKLNIADYILILVMFSILGHSYIGKCLNFYNRSIYYDRYLHVFGSFSFAIFSYSIITSIINTNIGAKIYTALFVITLGISLGVFLEIIEFIIDSIYKTKNQRGLRDTDFDMISNIIGSLIAGIFAFYKGL